jgi:hypothetical protein
LSPFEIVSAESTLDDQAPHVIYVEDSGGIAELVPRSHKTGAALLTAAAISEWLIGGDRKAALCIVLNARVPPLRVQG